MDLQTFKSAYFYVYKQCTNFVINLSNISRRIPNVCVFFTLQSLEPSSDKLIFLTPLFHTNESYNNFAKFLR